MGVVTNGFYVAVSRVASGYSEHPPKRQQQAADAKAPEITPFTSQAPRSPLTGVKRGYLISSLLKARKALQGKVGNVTIYRSVTGSAGRTAPFSICAIFYVIWRLYAA